MPTAQLVPQPNLRGPPFPVPTPCPGWRKPSSLESPSCSAGYDQPSLDLTHDEALRRLVSWTGTAEHAPCSFQRRAHSPLPGNPPIRGPTPGAGPSSHCAPPLPAAQPGGTPPGNRQRLESQKARGRKDQSWREGRGRRGHLSSVSVPQE